MNENAASRLRDIQKRIEAAMRDAPGNDVNPVLVAVSKTFEVEAIEPLIAAGQCVFGENRVQEAARKWPALKEKTPEIELHLIGPLQTNKLKQALQLFDAIHTLDRPRLVEALVVARDAGAVLPKLFVQVNIGREPQKAGVMPQDAERFIALCREEADLSIEGLMCIPPADEDPVAHFDALSELAAKTGLLHLSMGMSADFETAIRHGASYVRVGSALFGQR